ncbi:MAG: polymerase alpha subunit [Pseudomonadota bacterium]
MSQFVHLHLHTQYSLLDGANKLKEVIAHAAQLGQPAIAMTDHGNMHGAVEFYYEAKKGGIKPIIGCELYVTPGSRHERKMRAQGGAGTCHLTVLAANKTGYHNLCKLSSLAYKEGFYFKPRVDHELLERYSEGLIVLSGCLAGEVAQATMVDDYKGAKELVEFYARTFKDRYYLELQPHPIDDQRKHNAAIMDLAQSVGVPLVATTDCHYLNRDDHFAQEVLMCISTGKTILDPDRLRHEGFTLHLKTEREMIEEFENNDRCTEAIRNSALIASQCDLSLESKTYYMPRYECADERPLIEIMAQMAREGLTSREESLAALPGWGPAMKQQYLDRLEEEISLIGNMGFAGYFLVVADFIVWAKDHGIPVGPGRGSVAGSLVAYAMRITEVDPISNKLFFERFLNPERISMPDIDVDFCIHGREHVIKYVIEKYGKEKVSQIATFGTLKAKAAIKDVGRALGMSYAETDRIAQLVPAPRQGFDYPISEALKMEPKLAEYAAGEGRELIELAQKLEGLTRHSSTHAAGVVIGDRPLDELLPMMVDKDGNDVTQYSMTYVEKVGLVKFDFLGLKTLTVLHTACQIIKESRGVDIDLNALPLNDPKTYTLLCGGNTTGVFQLESSGITEMVVRLKPSCFDDIVAILALYRPGPLDAGMVDHYIERKHGREPISYLHPLMKDILMDTYGVILYQEQIMQLARALSGYSLGEADILRKAMGKKNPEEMAKQKTRFVEGAVAKGIPQRLADEIFQQMETFARYGFNRSHTAAYALVSFQTAYLKAHYGVEFMAALMTHDMEDTDKTFKNFNECRKQGIAVLPPNINESSASFTVRSGKILFGLEAVKGTGQKAVEAIVRAREDGPFKDLEDLISRVDLNSVNKRVFENMVKSGAFDFSKVSRREMSDRLEDLLKVYASRKDVDPNQMNLFGAVAPKPVVARRAVTIPEWPVNQKLSFEREALGFYISGHPLEKFKWDLKRLGALSTADVKTKKAKEVRVGGVITALKLKNTKKGDRYASFALEDWLGTIDSLVWPDTYRKIQHLIVPDEPVMVTGRADVTEERCVLVIDKMESLIQLRDRSATQGFLMLTANDDIEQRMPAVQSIFRKYTGSCPVKVRLQLDDGEVSIVLRDSGNSPVCVGPSEALCEEVEQLFGRPVLTFM